MSFGSVDDILKHYGREGEVKYSEVKKDESDGSQGVPGVGKDSEGKGRADTHTAEGIPKKHGNSL
ncbi:hypothetical protein ACWA2B_00855 [Paenibacillus sp. CMM36]